jgi:hypothetical protein
MIYLISYWIGVFVGFYIGLWVVVALLTLLEYITKHKFDDKIYFNLINVEKRLLKLEYKNGGNTNKSKK